MYMKMTLTAYRRTTQVLFILLVFMMPVLDILRYDSDTHRLFVLGKVWSLGLDPAFYTDQSVDGAFQVALRFILKAVLPWMILLSIFPLLGWFTGRFFCGWLCPEGTLFEFADFLTLKLLGRRSLYGKGLNEPALGRTNRLIYGALAIASAVIIPLAGGVALTGYFVAPKTIWGQISDQNFTFGVKAGILGVAFYMLITSVLIRHVLCKFVCAAGLMQMLFGWASPFSLRLRMDTARVSACTDCRGCDKACFMNVIPRKNKRDISCVNCGACIAACNKELGNGNGLFHFGFGSRCIAPRENCKGIIQDKTINPQ